MMTVVAAPRQHLSWIHERTGCVLTPDARAIEAIDTKGRIRGMVAFDIWTQNSVWLHIAVETPWAWRYLLGPGLEYPFIQGNRGVCLGLIAASNEAACRFAQTVGFKELSRIKDGRCVGDDLVIFQLRREDWAQRRRDVWRERKAA